MNKRAWRDVWWIAAGLALLAWALAAGGWTWRLDRLLYDMAMAAWREAPPEDIVIVAIDDRSIAEIGRWPWARAVHATLLERIAAAAPRGVVLDMVLSEDAAHDEVLAAALARAQVQRVPVVMPVAWQTVAGLPGGAGLGALEPQAALRASVRLGAAEAVVDSDGVLRHAFLRAGPAARPYPHLALALLDAAGQAPHARLPIDAAPPATFDVTDAERWRRDGRFAIRYLGAPGSFQRLAYIDVLAGRIAPEQLRGRYVLVGMTAQGLGDTLATPVNASAKAMPGVEVLANIVHTLRSGQAIASPSIQAQALASALLVALLVAAMSRLGPRRALPFMLGAVPLLVLAPLVAMRLGVFASTVPAALALLPAYPLWSWRRLERAMSGLDDELQRLAAQPLLGAAGLDDSDDPIATRLELLQRGVQTVRDAQGFLAEALAALPSAVLVADPSGRVLLANQRAAALFEVGSADELHGLDLARLLGEFTSRGDTPWAELIHSPKSLVVEARSPGTADTPEHGELLIHLDSAALRGQRCLVVAITDVQALKAAERQREEALAFVSHDMRSPAQAIVTLADLHAQGALADVHAQRAPGVPDAGFVAEVRQLALRTLSLSDEFVRAAQAQTRPLQIEALTLADLLDAGLAEQQAPARAAGLHLLREIDASDAARCVHLDRLLVERAIANLVSNALRHSPPAGTVFIGAALHGQRLSITVHDQGPGLSAAQQALLEQGSGGLPLGHARGVGLGLQFVQQVAARHGGRLRAESSQAGARLVLELQSMPETGPAPETTSGNP